MERHDTAAAPAGEQLIDEELARVAAAIELVATGPARRVTLAGLRFGESLAAHVESAAHARGVLVRPLWPMGDGPVDLLVESDRA
jgi:hypothetical protein